MAQAPAWLADLDDAAIARRSGTATFGRGQLYFQRGAVRSIVMSADTIVGRVAGSRGSPYDVLVTTEPGPDGSTWASSCSCPMEWDCKHVVAVVIKGRQMARGDMSRDPSRKASWEQVLAPVVSAPSLGSPQELDTPLALQFSLVVARQTYSSLPHTGPRVRIRPLMLGRSGRWIKTGAAWSDFAYGANHGVRREHSAVMEELWQLATSGRSSYQYSRPDDLDLATFPPAVWRTLRRAHEVGVHLLATTPVESDVVLPAGPGTVSLDILRDQQDPRGQGAVLRTEIHADGQMVDPESVGWLGEPIHGYFTPARPARGATLTLTALERPLDREVSSLVRRGAELAIPANDVPRFLTLYYPRLRKRIDVGSSDGSITLPEVVMPRLLLQVAFGAAHAAAVSWSVVYGDGTDVATSPTFALGGGDNDLTRDATAERELVEHLAAIEGLPSLGRVVNGRRTLVTPIALSGHDTRVFVTDVLPALQASDDVVVVVTGEPADYRYAEEAPVIALSAHESPEAGGGSTDWFDLGVTVTVSGQEVPFKPLFEALARGDERLMLDSGTWFSLERSEFDTLRRLITEARALSDRPGQGLRLTPYQAGLWEELVELGVVASQSERWERTVRGLLRRDDVPVPDVPAGLTATLRPYQHDGFGWLAQLWDLGLGGILADDMGLGKTLQTLALAQHAWERGELSAPLLIVAPTSVLDTWAREAERFAPQLPVVVLAETGKRRLRSLADAVEGAALVVTSYAIFRIDDADFQAQSWSGLVLDEAQFVKNHQAKTYGVARRLRAPFKLAITGTPLENSLMDLWSLLSIVAPGAFPSPERFAAIYRRPIEAGGAPDVLESLKRRIRPLMLRRTKELVASELPPKQEQVLHIALEPAHRRTYDRHLQRERQRVLGLIDEDFNAHRIAILKSLTTLRMMALHPSLADPDYAGTVAAAKIEALVEQLREVAAEGHRALVFSQFTSFLAMIRTRLADEGLTYSYLDGRTRDRSRVIEGFRTNEDPVFLISLKAGGFGLTLTEADYVFVMDPWWNPAAETQAIDRTHRIGQDKTVMVYRLVAKDTIEEKVLALQDRKRALFTNVVEEGAMASGALGADDIRALLAGD